MPVRSSSGQAADPGALGVEELRHGTDEEGERFLAAFTTAQSFTEFGPPASDHVRMLGRDLFTRAHAADTRVVVDPGASTQVEIPQALVPFLVAGIDPNSPDALRARTAHGELASLRPPGEIPEPFGAELRRVLGGLSQVERAWLLRTGEGWTVGVQLVPEAMLDDFDAVRNRLHALATERLGSRRLLAVTDLRAQAVRDAYDSTAAPFYLRRDRSKGFLSRLLGR